MIADDEPLVRRGLRRFLASRPELRVVGEARDGREAIEVVERERPGILFLDVQMPVLDGIAVARALRADARPLIIFVTAYDRYAVEAFDVHAVDYVLKPFDEQRLARAVDRAVEQRHSGAPHQRLGQLLDATKPRYLTRLLIRTGARLQVLCVEDVEWFEAADNYVRAHTAQGYQSIRGTLHALEEGLDPAAFIRVHRTAIVRMDAVKVMTPKASGDYEMVLASGVRVPLSRQLRESVIARLGRLG